MFNKVLVANRGEIAVRIIRACHELGIKTVAIYSKADKDSLHVQLADQAVCVGPSNAKDSYLNIPQILSAAIVTQAEAIHPGFGFLAENSNFAEQCAACNIKFIGPSAHVIDQLGDKAQAKIIAKKAGVPTIPDGGVIDTLEIALQKASQLEYPVMIKAAAGGGGKGLRHIKNDQDMDEQFEVAKKEARAAFGDDTLYIEKYIDNPKHIEVQILADELGNTFHLYERECSVQRNHQKIIEEAPCVALDATLKEKLYDASIKLAKEVGYANAGTVEFLVSKDQFYFMEMNTRIQVEHPVTEMITGLDIVKLQILVATGQPLPLVQKEIPCIGHAIEVRINAQDPENDLRPSTGTIDFIHLPLGNGVRVDTHLYAGFKITPFYDAMLCKVICHAQTREQALAKTNRCLEELVISGCKTNIIYLYDIIHTKPFVDGEYSTTLLEKLGEFNDTN